MCRATVTLLFSCYAITPRTATVSLSYLLNKLVRWSAMECKVVKGCRSKGNSHGESHTPLPPAMFFDILICSMVNVGDVTSRLRYVYYIYYVYAVFNA